MGFEPQLRRIIEQSDLPAAGPARQTLMFSATFADAIQAVAAKYLQKSFAKVS
jgi:ATP-dependent RNA helicase DDX3X